MSEKWGKIRELEISQKHAKRCEREKEREKNFATFMVFCIEPIIQKIKVVHFFMTKTVQNISIKAKKYKKMVWFTNYKKNSTL